MSHGVGISKSTCAKSTAKNHVIKTMNSFTLTYFGIELKI